MKAFILFVVVMLPNGEMKVRHEITDECPSGGYFTAAMETKKIYGEFTAWTASCFSVDMQKAKEARQ